MKTNLQVSWIRFYFFEREPGNEKFHCNKNDHYCYDD